MPTRDPPAGNASHALQPRVRAAAAAIANARGGRRGNPVITNVLDILPTQIFDEVVEDAHAALAAADAADIEHPRHPGPVTPLDVATLGLGSNAGILIVLSSGLDGVHRAIVWGRAAAHAELEPAEATALFRSVAASLTAMEDAASPSSPLAASLQEPTP